MAKTPEETKKLPKVMIRAHDLWKRYGSVDVLKGLSLDVFEGETVVVLGRSGVGKSVLLKQIIGIEKPDRGYVEIGNLRVSDLAISKRYKTGYKIGMLFSGICVV